MHFKLISKGSLLVKYLVKTIQIYSYVKVFIKHSLLGLANQIRPSNLNPNFDIDVKFIANYDLNPNFDIDVGLTAN